MDKKRIGALILAAGRSSRMKKFKPLLPIRGKPFIEHVVELLRSSGITKIIVVAGYRSEDLIPFLQAASCECVINPDFNGDMFSSIQLGVRKLKNRCDAFFLLPVDVPLVRPTTIRQLLDVYEKAPQSSVYYPQYKSRRGHPPLIHKRLIDPIIEYHGADGMRGLLYGHRDRAMAVNVADPFILMDADTPEDLIHLETVDVSLG